MKLSNYEFYFCSRKFTNTKTEIYIEKDSTGFDYVWIKIEFSNFTFRKQLDMPSRMSPERLSQHLDEYFFEESP